MSSDILRGEMWKKGSIMGYQINPVPSNIPATCDDSKIQRRTYMRGELGAVELTLLELGGVSVISWRARSAPVAGKVGET